LVEAHLVAQHIAGHSPDQDQVEGLAPSVGGDEELVKGRVIDGDMLQPRASQCRPRTPDPAHTSSFFVGLIMRAKLDKLDRFVHTV
jgi:hypothetical protein